MKEGREENPAALPESEGQFRNLSDDVAISIWNEDLSGVYDALEQLRIDGVTNLRQYLTDYPQTVWDMLAMVRVVHVNKATLKLFGAKAEEEFISQIGNTFGSGASDVFVDELCAFWEGEGVFSAEAALVASDGTPICAIISFNIPFTREGFKDILVSVTDITALKKAENRIVRFNSIVKHSQNEIYTFDRESLHFVYANRGAIENIGYSLNELQLMTPLDIKPEITKESFLEQLASLEAGSKKKVQFTTIHARKDGSTYPVEINLELVPEEPPIFMALILDITERKQAAAERDQLLHEYGERIKELCCMYAIAESIQKRETLAQVFDDTVALMPGGWQYPEITCAALHFDDQKYFSKLFKETEWTQSADIVVAENRRGSIEVFYLEERPELDEGPFLAEERNLIDGLAHSLSSAIENVESNKKKEVALAQLRQGQKMEAIGQLTGGIAHDFNNILAIILGNVDMLQIQMSDDRKTRKRLKNIAKSTQRAVDLTRQLLGFSGRQAAKTVNITINPLIKGMKKLISSSVTPQVEMDIRLAEELWLTEINAGDFEDTLLNLILNARDAIDKSGLLIVETFNCTLDAAYCALNHGVSPGEYVQLAISDDGAGMSPKMQERIFEPFFTTKRKDKGTGLGLSMVYGFVNRSGGHIKVYSERGVGTTIRLYLPRSKDVTQPQELITGQLCALPQGNETILVVDDEEGLLELAQESLQGLGYRVLTANNAQQALEKLVEEPDVDLLFSDVVMPGGLNGYELAEKATEEHPQLKVLLTSGFTSTTMTINRQVRFEAYVLPKPYTQAELAQLVRERLRGPEVDDEGGSNMRQPSTLPIMTCIEWTEDLGVNVKAMDDDHQVLLEVLNRCQLAAVNGDETQCETLLNQAQVFAKAHLRREEAMMTACGYPNAIQHRQVHQFMLKNMDKMAKQLEKGELGVSQLANFLASWWTDHIQTMDRAYASYCQGKDEIIEQALEQLDSESEHRKSS